LNSKKADEDVKINKPNSNNDTNETSQQEAAAQSEKPDGVSTGIGQAHKEQAQEEDKLETQSGDSSN